MTFEEWFIYEYGPNWKANYSEESYFLAEASWNAAKEDSKPVANVIEFEGVWFTKNSDSLEEFETKDAAEKWAIDNGYRVEES